MEEEIGSSLLVFELLGLQCFSLKRLTLENERKRPTILRTFYMFILFCCILILTICFVSHDPTFKIEKRSTKDITMFTIQNSMSLGLLLVVLTSFVESYFFTPTIKNVFINCKEISRICHNEFTIKMDFKKIKKEVRRRIIMGIVFILTINGIVGISHAVTDGQFILPLFEIFPTMYLLMIAYKFVFYVGMVNNQLYLVKKLLESMFENQPPKNIEIINNRSTPPNDLLPKFRAAWKIYNIIYENGGLINDSQGLTILIMICSLTVAIIVSGYKTFVILVGGASTHQIPG